MRRVSAPSARVVIIGAGSSTLVDAIAGERSVVAVDIASAAIASLRERLGAAEVEYIVSDVLDLHLDVPVEVWHDRATFHFLVDDADQHTYAERAAATVRPGGHLVMATFAPSGPTSCSGLAVQRHDADSLVDIFGGAFDLVEVSELDHHTPWDATQRFTQAVMRRRNA